MGSPSRLTKSTKESPRFSMPMRFAATPMPRVRPVATRMPATFNAIRLLDAGALRGRCARWINPAPCRAVMASLESFVEVLANDENGLAIAVAVRVRVSDIGRE